MSTLYPNKKHLDSERIDDNEKLDEEQQEQINSLQLKVQNLIDYITILSSTYEIRDQFGNEVVFPPPP